MHNDIPDREPDLTALELRLAGWRPAAGALDRDRMLYEAGRATAAAGARPWRLATAALLLVSLGMGGLAAQQRSRLGLERALMAHEQARRLELETALSIRADASRSPIQDAAPAVEVAPSGPPAPGSYLVLTARLANGFNDATWPGAGAIDREPAPLPPGPAPAAVEWRPAPLRTQDIQRILDL
jgi:hypothetical protein